MGPHKYCLPEYLLYSQMLFWGFIRLHLADSLLSLLLIPGLSPLSDFITDFAIWKGLDFPAIRRKEK